MVVEEASDTVVAAVAIQLLFTTTMILTNTTEVKGMQGERNYLFLFKVFPAWKISINEPFHLAVCNPPIHASKEVVPVPSSEVTLILQMVRPMES